MYCECGCGEDRPFYRMTPHLTDQHKVEMLIPEHAEEAYGTSGPTVSELYQFLVTTLLALFLIFKAIRWVVSTV